MTTITSNNDKESTLVIHFDRDWKYFCTINNQSNEKFISINFNDQQWKAIDLPHRDALNPSFQYWYRKNFEWRNKPEFQQHVYLHFNSAEDDNDESEEKKIPSVIVWLNEIQIYSGTLPKPIQLTQHLRINANNILAICLKEGHTLALNAQICMPRVCVGQVKYDDVNELTMKNRRHMIDYTASFNDSDGLIDVFIDSLKKKKEDTLQEISNGDEDSEWQHVTGTEQSEMKSEFETGPIPRLAILMLIVGTRGDVQPFIALAKALLACGHRVRLATHETFRKFVRENGIEFYPLAGDPADLMSFMVKNAGIVPSVSSIVAGDVAKSRRVIAEILASTWKACTEEDDETDVPFTAEAIIANPPSYGHIHCAQKLQIPLHIVFTMPWSPTIQFPHPFIKVDYNRAPIDRINMLSYDLVEVLTWSGMRNIINEFRKETLGLPTLHTRQAVRIMMDEHVPHTYCWSPSFVPKPADWPTHIDVCGFFFLNLATDYKPPDDLLRFLKAGPPPIYIGFGSITGHDSDRILQVVLEALEETGYRSLLAGFDIDNNKLPDNIFKIGNCPHDWLFQHVSAVCHHGGAGTTAAGLRAGKPTIIVPFFGDQFFWGSMISKSGAGPAPMPGKTITTKQLVAAFHFVHEPQAQTAAQKISNDFQHENGCEVAVQSFHAHLPLSKMRSDLEPSFAACFHLNDYDLQISRPVAQVLISAELIDESQLSPHSTYTWSTLMHCDHFKAFTRGIKRAVSKFTGSMNRSKRSRSANLLKRKSFDDLENDTKLDAVSTGHSFKDEISLYGVAKVQSKDGEKETVSTEKNLKGNVRHTAMNVVEKAANHNRQHSINASRLSPAASPYKTISKPRTVNTSSATKKTVTQTNTKIQRSVLSKPKVTSQVKENKSPEEKAATMSGFSLDVCKQILADFKKIQQEREQANNNEKSIHQLMKFVHPLRRSRSRSKRAPTD